MAVYEKKTWVDAPAEDLYRWHTVPGALEKLIPPDDAVEVLGRTHENLIEGSRVTLRVGRGLLGRRWVAEHRDLTPGRGFRDVMVEGPFARWEHTHRFEPAAEGGSWLSDRVEYEPPLGLLGRLALGKYLARKLEKTFEFRHAVTKREVEGR